MNPQQKLVRFFTFRIDHKLKKNLRDFEIWLIYFTQSIQSRKLLIVSLPCADVPSGENRSCNNFKRQLTLFLDVLKNSTAQLDES